MSKKLPKKLPFIPFPMTKNEIEMNEIAKEYNTLDPEDSRREILYKEFEDKMLYSLWD